MLHGYSAHVRHADFAETIHGRNGIFRVQNRFSLTGTAD